MYVFFFVQGMMGVVGFDGYDGLPVSIINFFMVKQQIRLLDRILYI
jgi:hypothetical protein